MLDFQGAIGAYCLTSDAYTDALKLNPEHYLSVYKLGLQQG